MLKVHHTVYPSGREPQVKNNVKDGGLWYRDEQEQLLNQARRIARNKPKDEVAEAMKIVRIVLAGIILIGVFYLINL
ncbi:hypothetical protein [Pedobacter punctiformis]|uniref:Uncharacterized protein n=1 Tax=Pedobacter punctiformis TaxID=3004097 RepID=A0ABT4LAH9_9SPHI|nr:hypothetical protein [Pedobacter sp. HCMS5-2]MCZ4244926.1 hypothetical protein [Pedobacter sp. HCMS5-2]